MIGLREHLKGEELKASEFMVRMECQVELLPSMIDHCGLKCQNDTRLT